VGVRVVEFASTAKQNCHVAMSPKQLIVLVDRLRNPKGYVAVVEGPLSLPFGTEYVGESTVGFARD
jgi:hypothetical protein